MTTILAIDTATEACSLALYQDGHYSECFEIIPRRHNQRLFGMLGELLPDGNLRAYGVDAVAYGSGPGSFTGLRIAASAVQGLAFAHGLPAIPISTLACLAQTALRQGIVGRNDSVLSMLDARVNEVYSALFEFDNELAVQRQGPIVCPPEKLRFNHRAGELWGVGSGFRYEQALPEAIRNTLNGTAQAVLPHARDLIPLALEKYRIGDVQRAEQVAPVYVRDEISWKKLAQQEGGG